MSSFSNTKKINSESEAELKQRLADLEKENQNLKEQLQSEQKKEQQFRKIFNASNDAIFIIDPQHDRILEANPQTEKLLGYSREELLNSVSISSIHPEEMPQLMAFTRQILAVGKGWTNELTCLTKCGKKRPAEISATVVKFENRLCVVALVRDISERLKAQKEAMQTKETLAELGELSSMIVHEIKNPLTTVLMGLEALNKIELPPREKTRLELANGEAQRLQSLLEEIRLYAKPQVIDQKEIDLKALIQEVLANQFTEHRVDFNANSESVPISGEPDKLKQILINLIRNALEAVSNQDTITCSLNRKQEEAIVQVHNYGSPIPPDILPKLTQPFFTTKSSGTGLGLAIVKRIVESHQGELAINSNAEDGTTITLKFPLSDDITKY